MLKTKKKHLFDCVIKLREKAGREIALGSQDSGSDQFIRKSENTIMN